MGLALASTLGLFVIGCDEPSAQTARARATLGQAVVLLDEAESGYNAAADDQAYPAFRAARLDEAEAKLREVAAQGDDFAQAQAEQLLAGVELAHARTAIDQAREGFARVSSRSVELFNYLQAVQRISGLITARTDDGGSVVSALQEGASLVEEKLAGVASSRSEFSGQRESAAIKAEDLQRQADERFARARELERQAFVADDEDARQEAHDEAYRAEIEGQALRRQAREAQIEAERFAEQIAGLETETSLWEQMSQQIAQLQQRVEQEGQAAARDVDQAGSARKLELTTVREKFDALNSLYEQQVDQPLTRAAEQAQSAVSRLEGASDAAFDRLAAQVEVARVLTLHAGYSRNFAAAVDAVAQSPAVTGTPMAQTLQSRQSALADQAKSLVERAGPVIAEAKTQAEALAGDGPTGRASAALAQSLQAYESRLN
jgi:hypothetical protein